MSRKLCPICGTGKRKRICPIKGSVLICVACCEAAQDLPCDDCEYHAASGMLVFRCPSCGAANAWNDVFGPFVDQLQLTLFPVEDPDGPRSSDGQTLAGESYVTTLTFPFEASIADPFWLLVHRAHELRSMQFVQAEILEILSRDRHQARVVVLAEHVVPFADVPRTFPSRKLEGTPPEPSEVFYFPLSVETEGIHTICNSFCQDGGSRAIFTETERGPALTLYAEGFSHFVHFGGHLLLDRDYYQRLLEGGGGGGA